MYLLDVFVVRVVKILVVVVLILELRVKGYILLRFIMFIFINGVMVEVNIELDWMRMVRLVLIKMVR